MKHRIKITTTDYKTVYSLTEDATMTTEEAQRQLDSLVNEYQFIIKTIDGPTVFYGAEVNSAIIEEV